MSPLQLDHVFVFTPFGAPLASRLTEAGFLEGSSATHPGQGTANRRFFFNNAYLELIWATSEVELKSPLIQGTKLFERSQWKQTGRSPFGIGLRSTDKNNPAIPFDSWEYKPPYLPPGMPIYIAENMDYEQEPLVFLFPPAVRPDDKPIESREPLHHLNSTANITQVLMTLPQTGRVLSPVARNLSNLGLATFIDGPEYLMELFLDNRKQGQSLDFRPDLPLVIHW